MYVHLPSLVLSFRLPCCLHTHAHIHAGNHLTTRTGAPLELGDTDPSCRLATRHQSMWVTDVISDLALNLTDGRWSANVLNQVEVPSDGT